MDVGKILEYRARVKAIMLLIDIIDDAAEGIEAVFKKKGEEWKSVRAKMGDTLSQLNTYEP